MQIFFIVIYSQKEKSTRWASDPDIGIKKQEFSGEV